MSTYKVPLLARHPSCFVVGSASNVLMRLFLIDVYGDASFVQGAEEAADTPATTPQSTGEPAAADKTNIEGAEVSAGLNILQKVLFLAVISGCVAVYLRMNKVKEQDTQGYEKSLA